MKDNDVIKALECFSDKCEDDCMNCPIEGVRGESDIFKDALDLINRQKAEIARLEDMLDSSISSERNTVDNIQYEKAEAIKEFAKRLKEHKHECGCNYRKKPVYAITVEKIDNLLEEMESERE